MAEKTKPASVVLEQSGNALHHPNHTVDNRVISNSTGSVLSEKLYAEIVYEVVSSKNLLTPPLGTLLLPSEAQALIDDGVDVSIRIEKKR